jgi:hypothetical protein
MNCTFPGRAYLNLYNSGDKVSQAVRWGGGRGILKQIKNIHTTYRSWENAFGKLIRLTL